MHRLRELQACPQVSQSRVFTKSGRSAASSTRVLWLPGARSERDDATPKKKTGEMLGAISPVGLVWWWREVR